MALPHPIDNEWRVFGDYFKAWYDVKDAKTGEIYEHCWPNGGEIRVGTKAHLDFSKGKHKDGWVFKAGECEVRLSINHPLGHKQLTDAVFKMLKELYE